MDREVQRLQVDVVRGMNDLRQQAEQIETPDDAERAWSEGLANLRAGFDQPGEGGRTPLDPRNRERFDLAFGDLSDRHAFSLGRHILQLRGAERQANTVAQAEAATESYVTAFDGDTQIAIADWMFQGIDGRIAAGEIPAELGEQLKDEWLDQADTARAMMEVDADDAAQFPEITQDDAAEVQDWIASDPDAARLVRALDYSPDSPEAVEAMAGQLSIYLEVDEGERHQFVNQVVERANTKFRAQAPRPMFLVPGEISTEGLRAAATRTIREFRAGRIDAQSYGREADFIQQMTASFDLFQRGVSPRVIPSLPGGPARPGSEDPNDFVRIYPLQRDQIFREDVANNQDAIDEFPAAKALALIHNYDPTDPNSVDMLRGQLFELFELDEEGRAQFVDLTVRRLRMQEFWEEYQRDNPGEVEI